MCSMAIKCSFGTIVSFLKCVLTCVDKIRRNFLKISRLIQYIFANISLNILIIADRCVLYVKEHRRALY